MGAFWQKASIPMQALSIDVVSDVVCPWCFIGKRRLESALATWQQTHPEVAVTLRWHPFQLNPDLPSEGMAREQYVREKFGARADTVYERVRQVGADEGIAFAFEQIARQPNTVLAHSLIAACGAGLAQDRMKEALLHAYFLEGRDLTRLDVLQQVAESAGMSTQEAQAVLDDAGLHDQVRQADGAARAMGISGVPFFIFNQRVGVSGAHEPEALLEAMAQSLKPQADDGK
jgi:predicted DsbA family dithiol-disulfide isomerase